MAPDTFATEKDWVLPEHKSEGPLILTGCSGILTDVTLMLCAALLPQKFSARTLMFPPAGPAVALMVDKAELPLQPEGSIQVYEVASGTAETE